MLPSGMFAQHGLCGDTHIPSKIFNDVSLESKAMDIRLPMGSFKGKEVCYLLVHFLDRHQSTVLRGTFGFLGYCSIELFFTHAVFR